MQYGWLIAGAAALTGALSMGWGYVKGFWAQVANLFVVTVTIRGDLEEAVNMYCWRHYKASPWGFRTYLGCTIFVRPVKRVQVIGMESIGTQSKLFWNGWRPVWLKRGKLYDEDNFQTGHSTFYASLSMVFLRGTLNLDKLLIEALNEFNNLRTSHDENSRYLVTHIFGSDGKPAQNLLAPQQQSQRSEKEWTVSSSMQNRILQWKPEELGTYKVNHGNAVGQLALNEEAHTLVDEAWRWLQNENWYKDRGIPWKRGWLLHGPPGTGKTSLIRAIAEDFDLPVFVYHLHTLFDNELQEEWKKMQANVPCIGLIEDIDAAFDGRTNRSGHLSFDCLLNCLDGLERADGVFLVITTNDLPALDRALIRPGRIDHSIEMGILNTECRLQMAQRILADWPDEWLALIDEGEGATGAEFQGLCVQRALDLYWRQV